MEKYLEELNVQQREAVLEVNGPILIIAGAGAGKTKTLTHRILHLIKNGVAPSKILAITFTNKASKEMRERVMTLLALDAGLNIPVSMNERPFVSTFHSLCVHILRENSKLLGITRFFNIYDKDDSRQAIKESLKFCGLDPKQYDPHILLSVISKEKGNNVTLKEYEERGSDNYFEQVVVSVWKKYEEILNKEKSFDFDDLLLKTARLFGSNASVLSHYRDVWEYVHVDEYQDTNKVQYEIMRLLVGEKKNVCVVGDVDQNIYSWRGADIRNLLNFEKDFSGAKIIMLEENYRSSETILSVANAIIKKNKNRFEKNLFTKQKGGELVALFEAFDENDEAGFVVSKSRELIENGVSPEKIAVLYRANFQSRILEEKFLESGLPYQVLGTRFFERKEVKDVLSFLKASLNTESAIDLKRVINVPPRGMGDVTVARIILGKENELSPAFKTKWQNFKNTLSSIKTGVETVSASEAIKLTIEKSTLGDYLKDEDEERYLNVMELINIASKYNLLTPPDGILKLLEDAALESDQDQMSDKKNGVRLMTVHASKGLEFDYVFVVGLEQDLFPHKPLDSKKGGRDNEEERRLFYVALTRARTKLFLSYALSRTMYGSRQFNVPSEFIFDIPDEYVLKEKRFENIGKVIYLDL